jgi:hypothetical protein
MSLYARTLRRAASILGSERQLSDFLGVRPLTLESWMRGNDMPPVHVFLRAVDIIQAEEAARAVRSGRNT